MNGVDKSRSKGIKGANHEIYHFLWADRLEVEESALATKNQLLDFSSLFCDLTTQLLTAS